MKSSDNVPGSVYPPKPYSRSAAIIVACSSIVGLILGLVIQAAVIGVGVYEGEYHAMRSMRSYVIEENDKATKKFLQWQQDQIKKYEQEHPGSKPSTKDFNSDGTQKGGNV